jgi:hypothetical protein
MEESLNRLNNRTTNADVVDRMHATQEKLEKAMQYTTATVTGQLMLAEQHIELKLNHTQSRALELEARVTRQLGTTLQ